MIDQTIIVDPDLADLVCDCCDMVLTANDHPVCEDCYQDKEINWETGDILRFADELNVLGDQIRDNRGDRERWWNAARDLASELRAWGKDNGA